MASAREIFAAKILILAIISVILAVGGALLARELHRWIRREKWKHLVLGLLMVSVFAVLVFSVEVIFQQLEIVVHFFMPAAAVILLVYESEKEEWSEKITVIGWGFWRELQRLSKDEWLLPLACAFFPAGSWAMAYFLLCYTWRGQVTTTFSGSLFATAVLAVGIRRLIKRDNL